MVKKVFISLLLMLSVASVYGMYNNDLRLPILHTATRDGHEEVIQGILSSYGQDINAQDNTFVAGTALHWATYGEHVNIVVLLLDYGADSNIQDSNGNTPLDIVTNLEIKKILEDHKHLMESHTFIKDQEKKKIESEKSVISSILKSVVQVVTTVLYSNPTFEG